MKHHKLKIFSLITALLILVSCLHAGIMMAEPSEEWVPEESLEEFYTEPEETNWDSVEESSVPMPDESLSEETLAENPAVIETTEYVAEPIPETPVEVTTETEGYIEPTQTTPEEPQVIETEPVTQETETPVLDQEETTEPETEPEITKRDIVPFYWNYTLIEDEKSYYYDRERQEDQAIFDIVDALFGQEWIQTGFYLEHPEADWSYYSNANEGGWQEVYLPDFYVPENFSLIRLLQPNEIIEDEDRESSVYHAILEFEDGRREDAYFEILPFETDIQTPSVFFRTLLPGSFWVVSEVDTSRYELAYEPETEETKLIVEESSEEIEQEFTADNDTDPEEVESEEEPSAFSQSVELEDMIISVEAPAGVFPENAVLSVEQIENVPEMVDAALEESRDEELQVAVSYTFDIKILDPDGKEIQPENEEQVQVSFRAREVSNENLSSQVYHMEESDDGSIEAIPLDEVETINQDTGDAEETITVLTDGFSFYTVEFTYEGKQYVLNPEEIVTLNEVLEAVGLVGNMEGYEVSNEELFGIVEDWGVQYIDSRQPFDSEEWLDVTLDGVTYRITVTDDQVVINKGNTTVDIDGVYQGTIDNFTANLPIATIFIDETKINQTRSSRDAALWGHMDGNTFVQGSLGSGTTGHPGFVVEQTGGGMGSAGYYANEYLTKTSHTKKVC